MRRNFALILIFTAVTQAIAYADIIHLKNGRAIEGDVLEEAGGVVDLKVKVGKISLRQDDIAYIEKKELPADFYEKKAEEKAERQQVSLPEVEALPPENELKAEGYGEAKSPKFDLNIRAELRKLENGDAILVKYNTNLPPKTVLYLALKAPSKTLVVRKQSVQEHSYAVRLGPFDRKRFSPGIYTVEVSFVPSMQESTEAEKELEGTEELIASAEITVGSPAEFERTTGKRKRQLVSELRELEVLYNDLNREYSKQNKNFNKDKWLAWSEEWKPQVKKIRAFDEDYRNKTLVLDYEGQENVKMAVVDALELLWARYTHYLFLQHHLAFDLPPSPDTRDILPLNKSIQQMLGVSKKFIEAYEGPAEAKKQ